MSWGWKPPIYLASSMRMIAKRIRLDPRDFRPHHDYVCLLKPPLIPGLTTVQMIEVDRAMIEDFRIELIQMMENAGRNLAHLARTRFLGGDPRAKRVIALAGGGGNGGGALVAARRLHNWGAEVTVGLAQSASAMTSVPAHQLDILERMGVPIVAPRSVASLAAADV